MTETYLTVAGRIRREIGELERVVARVVRIWEAHPSEEGYHVDAVALNLHGFYAGLERIFEIVAGRIDRTVPAGPSWHQEVLDQMATEISGVRPAVLSAETRRQLDRYRGFRHVVRNVYTLDFEVEQIELLVAALPDTMTRVQEDLHAFADTLERIASGD